MIGATILSPSYYPFAWPAIQRFMKFTGLPVDALYVHRNIPAFRVKLDLWRKYRDQSVVFFDADLWFIRPANLHQFDRPGFFAVPDAMAQSGRLKCQEAKYGVDTSRYFNSGFMIWSPEHAEVFDLALHHFCQHKDNGPLYDQSPLNKAVQELGVEVTFLDASYNYCPLFTKHEIQDEIEKPKTIHAAGWNAEHKLRVLRYYTEYYGDDREEDGHLSWEGDQVRT